MSSGGARPASKECRECSRWYFLGCLFWIGIFFLILWQAGGFGEISPEFALIVTITIGIIGIGALIIYSAQALRKDQQKRKTKTTKPETPTKTLETHL